MSPEQEAEALLLLAAVRENGVSIEQWSAIASLLWKADPIVLATVLRETIDVAVKHKVSQRLAELARERPTVEPLGNMNDLLACVCPPRGER